MLGLTSDISSIKTAQQELEKLSLIASKTTNGVLTTDLDTKIDWINEGFTMMTGYRLHEVKGTALFELFEDRDQLLDKETLFQQLSQNQNLIREYKLRSKASKDLWVLVNITPILDYELNPEQYIVVLSDLTLQKEHEKQLEEQKHEIEKQKTALDHRNIQLQKTVNELARAKIGRKSLFITFILAIILFIFSEVVVDPLIESYFERSVELVISGKLMLALALKPIEDYVRRSLFRREVKRRTSTEVSHN